MLDNCLKLIARVIQIGLSVGIGLPQTGQKEAVLSPYVDLFTQLTFKPLTFKIVNSV